MRTITYVIVQRKGSVVWIRVYVKVAGNGKFCDERQYLRHETLVSLLFDVIRSRIISRTAANLAIVWILIIRKVRYGY